MSTRRIPPVGDSFYAAGKRTEVEPLEALAEGEAKQVLPHTHREREERVCRSCYGSGTVLEDAEYNAQTGELVQVICECPICEGVGSVSVFLYAAPRRLL